jgi:hypothetical protein
MNKEITLAIIVIFGIGTSEFASNTSDAAILLPIIDSLVSKRKLRILRNGFFNFLNIGQRTWCESSVFFITVNNVCKLSFYVANGDS